MNAVMAAVEPTLASPSVVDAMIQKWRVARLSSGWSRLDLPRLNIIFRMMVLGHGGVSAMRAVLREYVPEMPTLTDAERVQFIVEHMEPEIRGPFEAFHIGIIRGESCRGYPHKARAVMLGLIHETEYRRRVDTGWRMCQLWIGAMLDFCEES